MRGLSGASTFVTGADGFIGSHLVEALVGMECKVTALVQYNSFGSAGWLDALDQDSLSKITVVYGDIRDPEFVTRSLVGQDVTFHLAALIAIPYSYEATRSYVDTNVSGTLNVLEAVKRRKESRLIVTSTSEVYGTPLSVPISESHPLNAQSPYAATKIAADQLTKSYAASFDIDVAILRPFNTYGPRQSLRAVIPTVLAQLLAGEREIRLGRLDPIRDFTFVSDTVRGFIAAAQAVLTPGETVQLGTGSAVSIGDLVDICIEITGASAEVYVDPLRVRPEQSEVMALLASPEKARRLLGWEPEISLREGLVATANWISASTHLNSATTYHR